jgi:hypothetical protein
MKSPQPENLEEVMSKTATNNEALSSLLVYLAKKIEPDTTSIKKGCRFKSVDLLEELKKVV